MFFVDNFEINVEHSIVFQFIQSFCVLCLSLILFDFYFWFDFYYCLFSVSGIFFIRVFNHEFRWRKFSRFFICRIFVYWNVWRRTMWVNFFSLFFELFVLIVCFQKLFSHLFDFWYVLFCFFMSNCWICIFFVLFFEIWIVILLFILFFEFFSGKMTAPSLQFLCVFQIIRLVRRKEDVDLLPLPLNLKMYIHDVIFKGGTSFVGQLVK